SGNGKEDQIVKNPYESVHLSRPEESSGFDNQHNDHNYESNCRLIGGRNEGSGDLS
ncbi:unnamed protein product, partial [marine sediment metagenome]